MYGNLDTIASDFCTHFRIDICCGLQFRSATTQKLHQRSGSILRSRLSSLVVVVHFTCPNSHSFPSKGGNASMSRPTSTTSVRHDVAIFPILSRCLLSSFETCFIPSAPYTTSFMLPLFMLPLFKFIYDCIAARRTTCSVPPTPERHPHVHRESNRLLPILRIYPDILEYIIILTANLENTFEHRRRTIISCSQTCHNWRIVALLIKPLWSGLVDFEKRSEKWNNEMLRRSYPCPIVVAPFHSHYHVGIISAELAHLERIRIYRVWSTAQSAWDILVEGLQQPAPHIEYLDVHCTIWNAATTNSFILPSTIFAGDAPHLRRLEMEGCLVNFQPPVLRSLTTLSVVNLNPLTAPSPLEWLEHLSHLPLLAKLSLDQSMGFQDRSVLSSITPRLNQIELSLLSELHLKDDLDDMHIFIEGLNFPVSCRFMACCFECYPGPELDIVLLAYLHRLDHDLQLRPENRPLSIIAGTEKIAIKNHYRDPYFNDLKLGSDIFEPEILYLDLVADDESEKSLLRPVLFRLQEVFPKFTSLELDLPAKHPSLIPCLVRATKITHLHNLSPVVTHRLLSQIQIIQPSDVIPLPALHTIMFRYCSDRRTTHNTLLPFLDWRRSVGHPITRILFLNCWASDDTVSSLKLHGVQVDRGFRVYIY